MASFFTSSCPKGLRDHLFVACILAVLAVAMQVGSAMASRGHVLLDAAAPAVTHPPLPPPKIPESTVQFLTVHNQARAAVGVAALLWSPKLEADATQYAGNQRVLDKCDEFVDMGSSQDGVNQALASYPASPGEVVSSWVGEGHFYEYKNNTCAKGHDCGTYTQVVWKKTTEVGCAQAICPDKGGASLTICLYIPHGNAKGRRPY